MTPPPGPPAGPVSGLSSIIGSLKGEYEHMIEPGSARYNPHTMEMSETELFDEDAHELQAMVTNNPFDLEIMMGDTNPQRNFGTVDNPVLLFSANVGWRYVMCTGLNDEDEGLSHVGIWFILREGPLHRCTHCGQVFKLINLKDELSEENDYYLEHYMPILEEEMGDEDDLVTRFTFHKFAEPYPALHPMQNANLAYILVNADDHDRILTDPAYRLQKAQEGHETLHTLHQAMHEIEEKILWARGGYYPAVNYTKADYEDLITSELAIRKLDRVFEKVLRFQKRAILEPLEHERREERMNERSDLRRDGITSFFNTTEQELRYQDYFESDYDPEDALMEEQDDYEQLLASGIFDFKNYHFVEDGIDDSVPAVESVFEQKLWKFKHRKWNDDPARHFIRENRMVRRYLDRMKKRDPDVEISLSQDLSEKTGVYAKKYLKYQDYVMDEAVKQYKDYYESDKEDIKDFEHITPEEKIQFAAAFKDHAKPLGEFKGSHTIAMRAYDPKKTFMQNLKEYYVDLNTRVLPEVRETVGTATTLEKSITKANDFQLSSGTYEFETVVGFEDLFAEHQKNMEYWAESPAPPKNLR